MSLTQDAARTGAAAPERRSAVRLPGAARRASAWWWLVAVCALALLACAAGMGIWWAASARTRITTYRVIGALSAITLDTGAAAVTVQGGGTGGVEVRRTDRFAFGHAPRERRSVAGGRLAIASSCRRTVLVPCRAAYRLVVPDNVPITVRTGSGAVVLDGLRGSAQVTTGAGAVDVAAFCGFTLRAVTTSGPIRVATACSPDSVDVRSGTGNVTVLVPPARYSVEASSDTGSHRVSGLSVADDAPFSVQALSRSGDVSVEGAP